MNLIFDCDNTFGVSGCDVDDGLALLYLLGSGKADLLGITSAYGNSDVETVFKATKSMLAEIARTDIPLLKGCAKAGEAQSEAVDFLKETVDRHSGNISILATGSLTNLFGAFQKDGEFFEKINSIVLMGGLTKPLSINGKILDELNFSCDPDASFHVLTKAKKVAIATGNNCLDAFFSREGCEKRLAASPEPIAEYICSRTAYWYAYNVENYGLDGFYNWDVMAAAYLLYPELFERNETMITPNPESLEEGFLNGNGGMIMADLPRIRDRNQFEDHVYRTYLKVRI